MSNMDCVRVAFMRRITTLNFMEQFWLLRIDFPTFDERLFSEALDVLKKTKYSLRASYEDAPWVTHCVSAVRFAFEKATQQIFPYYYVWDMCRRILDDRFSWAKLVPLDQVERRDIIFFHGFAKWHKRWMIYHVWIMLDEESFFHSTYGRWWAIDNISKPLQEGNIATCKQLSSYTDFRKFYDPEI